MIGYPSIRSVEFGKDVIKIERLVERVNENPLDRDAQKELIDNLEQLPASRCKTSSDAMLAIANAQTALGQYDSAYVTIQRAVELNPESDRANSANRMIKEKKDVQKRFEERIKQLEDVIKKLEKQPGDLRLRDTIAKNLRQLDAPVHLENHQIVLVAKALAIMDNKQEAVAITDNVLKINPKDREAAELRNDIKNQNIDKRFQVPAPKPQRKPSAKPNRVDTAKRVEQVTSPAPVFQDTIAFRRMLIPKSGVEFNKWNPKG